MFLYYSPELEAAQKIIKLQDDYIAKQQKTIDKLLEINKGCPCYKMLSGECVRPCKAGESK